jgi:3-dehydroquinate dehydratase type I
MRICGVILAKNMKQIISDIRILNGIVDLIEVRLDYREEEIELSIIRRLSKLPLIATNRSLEQGGKSITTSAERIKMLVQASEYGFQFIDIELDTRDINSIIKLVQKNGSQVIGSQHNFRRTPKLEELEKLLKKGEKVGVDLVKLIGTATKLEDNQIYLKFTLNHPGNISFGMGELGMISRVITPLIGGAFTYASIKQEKKSAPGQLNVSELKEIYRSLGVYN